MKEMVFGTFDSRTDAENAINELYDVGVTNDEISVVMKDNKEASEVVGKSEDNVVEGATGGALTGAIIGGVIGLAAFAIPGLGALLIGGPIAAALGLGGAAATTASGAVTGALAGGLIGALTNLGVPEEYAADYEKTLQSGGILLGVDVTQADMSEIKNVLENNGAQRVATNLPMRETGYTQERFDTAYPHEIHREPGETLDEDED